MSEKFDWEAMIQSTDNPLSVASQSTATGGVSLTITAQNSSEVSGVQGKVHRVECP